MPDIKTAKILIMATNGFEQSELEYPLEHLKKAGATVHVASLDGKPIKGWEGSDWGELYNLVGDPDEMTNLWSDPDHAAMRQSLLHRLLREMISLRDRSLTPTSLA